MAKSSLGAKNSSYILKGCKTNKQTKSKEYLTEIICGLQSPYHFSSGSLAGGGVQGGKVGEKMKSEGQL